MSLNQAPYGSVVRLGLGLGLGYVQQPAMQGVDVVPDDMCFEDDVLMNFEDDVIMEYEG